MDQWEISLLTCTELDLQCQAGTGRNETELDRKSDVGRSEQFATNLNRSRTYPRPEPAGTNPIRQ
jgi:hypothetical protein